MSNPIQNSSRPTLAPRFAASMASAMSEITGRPWSDTTPAGLDVSEVAYIHDDRGVGFLVEIFPDKDGPRYSLHWRMRGEMGAKAFNDLHVRMRNELQGKPATFGAMTASATKTIPTLAREVARRMLPEFEPYQLKAIAKFEAAEVGKAKDKQIAADLFGARGFQIWEMERGGMTFDGSIGGCRLSGGVYGNTTITASCLTPEQAAAVLDLIASFPASTV